MNERKYIVYNNIVSQYDALKFFLAELLKAFGDMGYQPITVQELGSGSYNVNEVLFLLSFNGGMANMEELVKVMEEYDLLSFCFFVDGPEIHCNRLLHCNANSIFSFVDRTYLNRTMRNFPVNTNSCFIAHGGSASPLYDPDMPVKNRDIDILFTGSLGKAEDHLTAFFERYGQEERKAAEFILEQLESDYSTNFSAVLDNYLYNKQGIPRRTLVYAQNFQKYLDLNQYYRAKYRFDTLKALLEMGFEVTVYANNTVEEFSRFANYNYHESCSYGETLDLMTKSKITLNIAPMVKQGSHERVFNAMLNGSVCLSTGTTVYPEDLIDGETLLFYDVTQPEALEQKVARILQDEGQFYRITNKAREIAATKHTWRNRAREMLNAVKFFQA